MLYNEMFIVIDWFIDFISIFLDRIIRLAGFDVEVEAKYTKKTMSVDLRPFNFLLIIWKAFRSSKNTNKYSFFFV